MDFADERPIFVQVAEEIENGILSGAFPEESQIPSTTEISVRYNINPATVLKGINLLVESGIIYKKRGIGMFVVTDVQAMLIQKRKDKYFKDFIVPAINEAEKIKISKKEIISLIERGFSK